MKEIKAFVRPERFNDIFHGLREAGHCCMTVLEAEGTGKYSDPNRAFPSLKHPFMHVKVVKLEILCQAEEVDEIVNLIHQYGSTGHRGDGLVYVSDVQQVYRVRDLEQGKQILNE